MPGKDLKIDIICPICNRFIRTYRGWGWTGIYGRCRRCNKLVIYSIEKDEFRIAKLPSRTSSGMTFY